jgi:non-ribosomal peptide synthetase component F
MEWTLAASPKSRREAHYGNRVVSCFAERPATVSDMFDATTAAKPDGEALVSGEQRWTWREVESEVAACAAALAERGIAAAIAWPFSSATGRNSWSRSSPSCGSAR